MRKFTVQSKKGETTIYELDVEVVTPVQDPSVMWLKPGEYKARIMKPESFHMKIEKTIEGKKEVQLQPDVWHSHALFATYGEALSYAQKVIEQEFEFAQRKYGKEYTDVDVAAATMAIKLTKLPGSTFKTPAEELAEKLK